MTEDTKKPTPVPSATAAPAKAVGGAPSYKDTLFEFPTEYPLKIAGKNTVELEATVIDIVRRHVEDFDHTTLTVRESKGGKYLAVSVSFTARSKPQLDALYQDLTDHPHIVWAL
ncbi:MAG TPA: DUF493 domain-containing protein [Casimicrobium sp.]|jgi:putative lipoic acid-binding regulatory protein|nr:DUF493 domain-containing protein [Casimicrobium sp.]